MIGKFSIASAFVIGFLGSNAASASDPVHLWNATLRQVIQADTTTANPGWSTRSMAMTNGAIYDVYQAFNRTHQPFQYTGLAPNGASQDAAIAQAAYAVMINCYQQQGVILNAALTANLNAIPDGPAKDAGIAFGNSVAQSYIAKRAGDNSDVVYEWQVNSSPGHWQPDPMHNAQTAWGPKWGTVTSFVPNPNPYTYAGVPDMSSPAYAAAFQQVKELGALNSATRTAEQNNIALFWAYDRPTMGPPPVLFNRSVEEISQQAGNTPAENSRLFAMASVAMADAAIAAWDYKFADDFWRPITAIRRADEDGNSATIADPNWAPMGAPGSDPLSSADDFTPPFPAWPSGHATMGGALFETLREFYGSDAMTFNLTSQELPTGQNTRSFTSFSQAEWENGISRIYLGIHWIFDATDGIAIGNQIATWISANAFQAVPEPSSLAVTISGAALAWGKVRRRNLPASR